MVRLLPAALLLVPALVPAAARPQPPADGYAPVTAELTRLIDDEVRDKGIPALSIALIDDQRVVWAAGFGHQDAAKRVPATAATVYRVGSVSKLFTDVAVMQLVEQGKLSLDAPVTDYLPGFQPAGRPDDKPITLRMLMAHRAGLVREPPVGHYFDPTEPTLEATVASLNGVPLVYPPGSREKYSNAGVAVVGRVVEVVTRTPFAEHVQKRVLAPLGMAASTFTPTPAVRAALAPGVMWTHHGRTFPAPTFELGESPAGCMYATVTDLAKFASCLFSGGSAGATKLLTPASVAEMVRPQYAAPGADGRFGLGFMVGTLDGAVRVGHGGAIYGFATEFAVLPEHKLGVVVIGSRDVANAVAERVADDALRLMRAAKAGKPLPKVVRTTPLPPADAAALAGRYRAGDRWFDLTASAGKLTYSSDLGGYRRKLRPVGDALYFDDVHAWGGGLTRDGADILRGGTKFVKEKPPPGPPPAPPAAWAGLVGEYGWDHNTLYVFEQDARLWCLIEWAFFYPLTPAGPDTFAFPEAGGLYPGEKLVFARDPAGRATKVVAAQVTFDRRRLDGEDGRTFRVTPVRPVADVRSAALKATPPVEKGPFRQPELVDLAALDPTLRFDIRYATANNFLGTPVYPSARAFLQQPAADALVRANAALKPLGYGLLVFDAYRPWHVTKLFHDATPAKFHGFVADPANGSRHNRGCAVDLTLYDRATGRPVDMVSGYDEFSDRAFPDYPGGTSRQRWHRGLLRRAMEAEGFAVYADEWWHFDYRDWQVYPLLNRPFEELEKK